MIKKIKIIGLHDFIRQKKSGINFLKILQIQKFAWGKYLFDDPQLADLKLY